jgi:septal ring factor EnvC (AmiA/AmiB activator)
MLLFLKLIPKKFLIMGILAALVSSGIMGSYWYLKSIRAKLEQSQATVTILESGVQTQQKALAKMQTDIVQINRSSSELTRRIQNQNQTVREMQTQFVQRTPEFQKLSQENPQYLEIIINQETAQSRRCMEIAMGSELTEQEKNDVKLAKTLERCSS